jgi:ariadne-1
MGYTSLFGRLNGLIKEVSDLFDISPSHAQILLQYCQWNKEKLQNQFFADSTRVYKECGIVTSTPSLIAGGKRCRPGKEACRICFDDFDEEDMTGLDCEHRFCRDCFGGYLTSKIGDGPSCVDTVCPEFKCSCPVTLETVENILSINSDSGKRYVMFLTRNFIEKSATLRWCPTPGCEQVAFGSGVFGVTCSQTMVGCPPIGCGREFCFKCGNEEAHEPASCRQTQLWQIKCSSENESVAWISVNTRPCPKVGLYTDRKSTRLNSSHAQLSRIPSSA